MKKLIGFILVALVSSTAWGETVVLQNPSGAAFAPIKVSGVSSSGKVWTNAAAIELYWTPPFKGTLVWVDLSSIDFTNKYVVSATYQTWNRGYATKQLDGLDPFDLTVGKIVESWTIPPSGYSLDGVQLYYYRNGPGVDPWAAGNWALGLTSTRSMPVPDVETDEWNVADITDIMQAWLSGSSPNYGIGVYTTVHYYATWGTSADVYEVQFLSPKFVIELAPGLLGDANGDHLVSADDYASVQAHFTDSGAPGILGDANRDGMVSADDYASVQAHFGEHLPEPATLGLLAMGLLAVFCRRSK